jgi:hypothetical protein
MSGFRNTQIGRLPHPPLAPEFQLKRIWRALLFDQSFIQLVIPWQQDIGDARIAAMPPARAAITTDRCRTPPLAHQKAETSHGRASLQGPHAPAVPYPLPVPQCAFAICPCNIRLHARVGAPGVTLVTLRFAMACFLDADLIPGQLVST